MSKVNLGSQPTNQTRATEDAPVFHDLPATGFLRQSQICGKQIIGGRIIHAPLPISSSQWWEWVKSGRAPRPIKLGPATTVWKAEEIHELIRKLGQQPAATENRGAALT